MRASTLLGLLLPGLAWLAPQAPAAAAPLTAADSVAQARTWVRWAREAMAESSVEGRLRAVRNLGRALALDPSEPETWNTLGNVYEQGAYGAMARDCYRNAIRLAPGEPEGHAALAMAWKREWIRTLDGAALDSAIAQFDSAVAIRPRAADPWLNLVPLRYERGDREGAREAALRAVGGWPRRPEAGLALAYSAYRLGELERADSAFTAAIPRLGPTLRRIFEQPAWIGLAGDPHAPRGAAAWDGLDPDPTTPRNELQLEYWSRVAHAYFVFFDPLRPELDARAETYVRYGPPRKVEQNLYGVAATTRSTPLTPGPGTVPADYPVVAQVWSYPDLGMRVVLQDRSLTGHYAPAATRDFDPMSVPNPGAIAGRGDLVSLGNGAAVFPTLPPREQRLDVQGIVARFESERRPRLLVQVQTPGAPGEVQWARWVVLDSTGREISRESRALGVSACDPAERRVGEFSADLPPGAFRVAVSVQDAQRRRGLFRDARTLTAPEPGLALSDVVLSCGEAPAITGSAVRLEANIGARVAGSRPLVAYFEIYRLTPGPDGLSRFAYEYAVRRLPEASKGRAKRAGGADVPTLGPTSREESQVGGLRRQFVTVPVTSLSEGRYRLEIRVHDLVAGTVVEGGASFVRE